MRYQVSGFSTFHSDFYGSHLVLMCMSLLFQATFLAILSAIVSLSELSPVEAREVLASILSTGRGLAAASACGFNGSAFFRSSIAKIKT